MKTCQEVLSELAREENPSAKAVLARHGAQEPFYGISLEWLKAYAKALKKAARAESLPLEGLTSLHGLGLELWASGVSDARYLGGLLLNPPALTALELDRMAREANWSLLTEYIVAGLAAESGLGWTLGLGWIQDPGELLACVGWSSLASVLQLASVPQPEPDEVAGLLQSIVSGLASAPNRVRYCMNNFMIAAGAWDRTLTPLARECADRVGVVKVYMGATSCKVPAVGPYLDKIEARGRIGHKRKRIVCE